MPNTDTSGALDIVIPGLFSMLPRWQQELGEIAAFPVLERLLSAARCLHHASSSPEALIFSLVTDIDSNQVPAAAIRSLDRQSNNAAMLCADPVCLNPGMQDLTVLPALLETDEVDAFTELLNQHLNEQDLEFELLSNSTGLVRGFTDLDIRTSPLSLAQKDGVGSSLPRGPSAAALQTLATEIQMLLFAAPFNLQREETGKPVVNGLWFWGEGALVDVTTLYERLYGGDFVAGLASTIGVSYQEPSATSLDQVVGGENTRSLIELSGLESSVATYDYEGWRACLTEYEAHWFSPLLDWLKSGPNVQVRLFDDLQRSFILRYPRWFNFPRKPKSLSNWADQ